MKRQVFKFPDGNGGWVIKTQNEDGEWLDCDQEGIPSVDTPNENQENMVEPAQPSPKRKKQSVRSKATPPKGIQFGLKIPEDLFELVTEYVGWKAFTEHRAVHRSEVFIQGAMEHIRKNKDFMAFRNSNSNKKERSY